MTEHGRRTIILHSAIIISILLILYGALITFDFVWDDIPFLKENVLIRSLKNIPYFFTKGMPTVEAPIHYRPLVMLSLALDYFFWEYNAAGYHLTNLILHLFSSTLVYFVINSLIKNKNISFIGALFFAVHPVHCDAVCWIMARGDILCCFFILLAFLCFLYKRRVMAILFFSLSLFSKEMAVTFPVVIFLYSLISDKDRRSNIYFSLYCFFIVIIFLIIRYLVLDLPFGEKQPIIMRLATSPTLIITYLKMVFLPYDLRLLYHGLPVYESFLHMKVIFSIVFLILIALIIIFVWKKEPVICFGLSFFFVALFPVSGVPVLIDVAMVAERYLYLPMIGISVFLAGIIQTIVKKGMLLRKAANITTAIVIILLSLITYNRKNLWKDEFVFLTKMVEDAPYYHEAKTILAYHYILQGNLEKAEELIKMALLIKPDYAEGLNTLGSVYLRKGMYDIAAYYFEKAVFYKPDHPEAHSNLAIVYAINKRYDKAEEEFFLAIKLKPNLTKAKLNLARMYIEQNRLRDAYSVISTVSEDDRMKEEVINLYNLVAERLKENERNR